MAPEMVVMLHQTQNERTGYCEAVDWWSFGVTLYKMLTGARAFANNSPLSVKDIEDKALQELYLQHAEVTEYKRLFHDIYYPSFIKADAEDIIGQFLEVDETKRLGYGGPKKGIEGVKAHPFFKSIDFDLLEQKRIPPPYIPSPPKEDYTSAAAGTNEDNKGNGKSSSKAAVSSNSKQNGKVSSGLEKRGLYDFEGIMRKGNKLDWLRNPPTSSDQKFFCGW
jgi:hypothetical protein